MNKTAGLPDYTPRTPYGNRVPDIDTRMADFQPIGYQSFDIFFGQDFDNRREWSAEISGKVLILQSILRSEKAGSAPLGERDFNTLAPFTRGIYDVYLNKNSSPAFQFDARQTDTTGTYLIGFQPEYRWIGFPFYHLRIKSLQQLVGLGDGTGVRVIILEEPFQSGLSFRLGTDPSRSPLLNGVPVPNNGGFVPDSTNTGNNTPTTSNTRAAGDGGGGSGGGGGATPPSNSRVGATW